MKLSPDTRITLLFLTGLAILLSQAVVAALGYRPSELMVGAALTAAGVELLRNRGGNGK